MSNNNIRIQGHDVMLFDSTGKSFSFGTNATLNITTEMKDVSDKDTSIYGKQAPGKMSWTMTSEHTLCWDEFLNWTERQKNQTSTNRLKVYYGLRDGFEGCVAGTTSSSAFDPDSAVNESADGNREINTYTYSLCGYVFIDSLSQTASNGDYANYTVNFTGDGALTKVKFTA